MTSTARCGHARVGSREATVARHRADHAPSDAASRSSAASPIRRRMSAGSAAAAMIRLVLSMWSATEPPGRRPLSDSEGFVRGGASARTAARSSGGGKLVICAAAVEPADVPMIRSAAVRSTPDANKPAMTPISHAWPADPPPPSTRARLRGTRMREGLADGPCRRRCGCRSAVVFGHDWPTSRTGAPGRLNCVSRHREARTRSSTRSSHLLSCRLLRSVPGVPWGRQATFARRPALLWQP